MDAATFDAVTRAIRARLHRRALGRAAGVGAVAALSTAAASPDAGSASRKRRVRGEHNLRGKRAIMGIAGETRRAPRKQRKTWLKRGATRGACTTPASTTTCAPSCPAGRCGDDGRCGQCPGCPAGAVCAEGVCQPCNVSCAANQGPRDCGAALQTAITAGGTIYLCPGVYQVTFSALAPVAIDGSGNGLDPAKDSILTKVDDFYTMLLTSTGPYTLTNLHLRGQAGNSGGGVSIAGATHGATLDRCAIVNEQRNIGGLSIQSGLVDITGCTIADNNSQTNGGGMVVNESGAQVTVTNTVFTRNTAAGVGGGIAQVTGTVTLAPSVSVTENDADPLNANAGGGIYHGAGTLNRNGATVTAIQPNNCTGC